MTHFDAASAEPPHPAARAALLAAFEEGWADPARLYRAGRQSRMLLDQARAAVAEVLGCRAREVFFTPSGTAAIHYGVAGVLAGRRRVGNRLVVSAVEHSAVLHAAELHAATAGSAAGGGIGAGSGTGAGGDTPGATDTDVAPDTDTDTDTEPTITDVLTASGVVSVVGVDGLGRVDTEAFARELRVPGTALACLQAANHEVGTVQPLAPVFGAAAEAGVPLLVDAAQVVGRLPVPREWSVLCASSHKWGGPAGVGVLAVRKGTRFAPTWAVDEHEDGRVPGAVNLPGIVAAAAALLAREQEREAEAVRLRALTERLRAVLPTVADDIGVFGDPDERLPNLVAFSCPAVNAEALVLDLDEAGFEVSSGSACTSDTVTPSHVLVAMGAADRGNVRISLPFGTAEEDVDRFLAVLPGVLEKLR
ncbi:Cysteine desulfurase [Catenulispora acidiphila DSM 44928]|uniref:Cysteine desulfurase n=1 Tax=Catenulispora acidiphila (strain DSM 44928 / JCM 14897 / NBRC 102108 / NRRL B-24433 / ID139908) TaxID=479433 RepID=C7QBL0_CATAD|nr:aminotransferase class V-fold PLP-dependent enzyme [Catenulispora acidiphila]ACU70587.1 Cysteine desulfurase [Catenulispora acidiphila DSM 44928]